MISVWLRAIRIKFLLASVIAVSLGLSLSWHAGYQIDLFHAILTFVGVISLHASVDLLNDYWDFKRGIDTKTKRTKMSGGTGVLPEGLLKPKSVYLVGIGFLILGSIIGVYFVIIFGKSNAVKTFLIFPILSYGIIIYGVVTGLFPVYSLIVLLAKPFLILALLYLKDLEKSENILLSSMTNTLYFSRVAGALFVISFLIGF